MGVLYIMKRSTIYLILLVIITFFLRIYWIDLTILEGDMFRDFEIADTILEGNIRYVGIGPLDQLYHQQSFGPLMYYLVALVLWLFKSPISVAVFVAIFNSIAVLLTFVFCKAYFNERIALITSFLYAVNPWSIYLSHSHWNPNYLPFFSIIFFYFIFGFFLKDKKIYLVYSLFVLSLMLQFHLTPLFFIPIILLILF